MRALAALVLVIAVAACAGVEETTNGHADESPLTEAPRPRTLEEQRAANARAYRDDYAPRRDEHVMGRKCARNCAS